MANGTAHTVAADRNTLLCCVYMQGLPGQKHVTSATHQ